MSRGLSEKKRISMMCLPPSYALSESARNALGGDAPQPSGAKNKTKGKKGRGTARRKSRAGKPPTNPPNRAKH